jgi:hypothetical protein
MRKMASSKIQCVYVFHVLSSKQTPTLYVSPSRP